MNYITIDNKYSLLKQLGEGGFGGIFLASETNQDLQENEDESSTPNYFAIKLSRNEKSDEIEREINLLRTFDHPNVLSIDDHSIQKGVLKNEKGEVVGKDLSYMVMPFASMGDLGSYLTGDTYFDEDVSVFLFHQVFHGLCHIHEKGFVHLDLKPDNILITDDYQLKIADFGLSQPLLGEDGHGNFSNRRCGTASFWAPEISLNFEYNGVQADLYALGIILFIIVFGCRPFRETKTSDPLFMKLLQEPLAFWMVHPVTRTRIKSRTVSEEIVDLLARMLIVNPEDRLSKDDIKKHPWMSKYNKDIYEENDYEDFEFCPEILNSDDDSDYAINEEDYKSELSIYNSSEDEILSSRKSISDIEVDSNYDEEKEIDEILQK